MEKTFEEVTGIINKECTKKEKFECFLECLYDNTDREEISMIKANKLLFLTVVASTTLDKEYSLLQDFDFQAWNYGAVDPEIYEEFKGKTGRKPGNALQYKNKIKKCVNKLLEFNNEILSMNEHSLIEIVQRYNSWKYNFLIGTKTPISAKQISLDKKIFTL